MAGKKKIASFVDQTMFTGQGLFEDEQPRVKKSVERIIHIFEKLPSSMSVLKMSSQQIEEHIRPAAHRISATYWAHEDFDNRMKSSQIKADTKKLDRFLGRCLQELNLIERPSRARIDELLAQRSDVRIGPEANSTQKVMASLSSLVRATREIQTNKIVKSGNRRVLVICEELWNLRERLTEEPFTSNWYSFSEPRPSFEIEPEPYSKRRRGEFFKKPDPLFVQLFIQAIDERVGFATILKDLKNVSKQRKQKNRLHGHESNAKY